MGVLMAGAAGTGKSIVAKAIGKEAGVMVCKLNIGGQIASKWQGEGERNLLKAFRVIEGFAPAIVFIDEIDQATGRGSGGGNAQESRMFNMLLQFMSETDHRGDIVFLAATNRPDLIDAAMKRPGRFDTTLVFTIPEPAERAELIKLFAVDRNIAPELFDADSLAQAVANTEGWTGAELEGLLGKVIALIEDEAMQPGNALVAATERVRANTQDIEFMTWLAVETCTDIDYLPPAYKEAATNQAQVKAKVERLQQEASFKRGKRSLN